MCDGLPCSAFICVRKQLANSNLTGVRLLSVRSVVIARMVLAPQLENLEMTKNVSKLIELKLAVIQYHNADNMDYLMKGIARDACYTSYNSLQYKRKQMSDTICEFEEAVVANHEAKATAIANRLDNMQIELDELTERHEADKSVYEIITDGEQWEPQRKSRSVPAAVAKKVAAMKKAVA